MHYLIALPLWLGLIAWIVMRSSADAAAPEDRSGFLPRLGWFALYGAAAAGIAVAVVGTGVLDSSKHDEAAARAAWVVPARSVAWAPVPMPAAMPMPLPAADPARVRVRVQTGLRTMPSRNAAVLRIAHQGDVLRRFGAANGWIQVGGARPEGWVPESLAAPAG